jgi:hypothetical protein
MALLRLSLAAAAALVLAGTATSVLAQQVQTQGKPRAALTGTAAGEAYTLDQSQNRRVLQFDQGKKWGLKLEMQQPVTREMQLKDMEAGAYFKFTPGFRVGGAVGLTDKTPAAPKVEEPEVTPRVRLETTFKF